MPKNPNKHAHLLQVLISPFIRHPLVTHTQLSCGWLRLMRQVSGFQAWRCSSICYPFSSPHFLHCNNFKCRHWFFVIATGW